MIDTADAATPMESLDGILRAELIHGEAVAGNTVAILRHLLVNQGNSVFSEEIIARVRGMLADLAMQFLDECAPAAGDGDRADHPQHEIDALVEALVAEDAVVAHLHGLAVEAQLGGQLQARHAFDPVVSPMVNAQIASSDADASALAMNFLAAQARFVQAQRRMTLALGELPAGRIAEALMAMGMLMGNGDAVMTASAAVRERYDEARTRLGLAARLITRLGGDARIALDVSHAGVALFLTALAIGSGQERDVTALSTSEAQVARLALTLRAAGMKPEGVAEQFVTLHPDIALPDGFGRLDADRAAAILAMAGGFGG